MSQIIGIKAITTKSGNKGYEYHVCDDFSEYDKTHATDYEENYHPKWNVRGRGKRGYRQYDPAYT